MGPVRTDRPRCAVRSVNVRSNNVRSVKNGNSVKHLKLVASGIDVRPLLAEIEANSEHWYVDTSRQEKISVQRDTHAIALRCHADTAVGDSRVRRAKPVGYRSHPTPVSKNFPLNSEYVDQLVRNMNGTMGRCVLAMLKPNGTIYPHADDGLYWLLRDRYHLALKSVKGSHFKVGGDEVRMQVGELWWFDHTATHEAFNDSEEDRIHIILDVMSPHSMKTFRQRVFRHPLRALRACFNAGVRRLAYPFRHGLSRVSTET